MNAIKILFSIILVSVFVVWTVISVREIKDYVKRRQKIKDYEKRRSEEMKRSDAE